MTRRLLWLTFGVLLLAGCSHEPEDTAPAGPAQVAFDGQIDPGLVGTWRAPNDDSILDLGKDGALQIESNFNTPNGRQKSKKAGKWLAAQDSLKLQYEESDGAMLTIAYMLKRNGNTMVLSTKRPKLEMTYKRD